MADCLERVIAESGRFLGVACITTELVAEGCRRHDVGPLAAAALGRVMTAAVLLSALMKDGQSLAVAVEGNGPLKKTVAEAGYDGWVRGYVAEPHADLPLLSGCLDVAGGVGNTGLLTVTKYIAEGKKYPGIIPLQTGEIGEDVAWYLTRSEQIPSTLAVTVSLLPDGTVSAAGGFLVQSLPPAEQAGLDSLEKTIAALGPLSGLLAEGILPGAILSRVFQDIPHRILHKTNLFYQCSCSQEKMMEALLPLGCEELYALAEEKGGCEVRCEFCRQRYFFQAKTLRNLAGNIH